MKQNLLYAAALTIMMALGTNGHATSWRVNTNTTRGANFADINAAMSSADVQDGDTLYLDPGCNFPNRQNVTKCVTIIGNGFFHDKGQPYGYTTISGETYLRAVGCKIEGVVMTNTCFINANNVTIERCKLTGYFGIMTEGTNCSYATIRNCYIDTYECSIQGAGQTSSSSMNWTIQNNMINSNNYDYNNATINGLNSATISNNFIRRYRNDQSCYAISYVTNCTFLNNIILVGNMQSIFYNCIDCVVNHNVLSCAENTYTNYPTNKCINTVELSTIFTMSGANDLRYQLCEDSPAKGYATDGGDCGPYGSGYTYVAGGLPLGKPYYTEATIGSMAHDGKVNVSFKIAVQDE